jgi:hypothetical protein
LVGACDTDAEGHTVTASTRRSATAPRARSRRWFAATAVSLATVAGLLCAGSSGPATADASGSTPGTATAKSAAITESSPLALTAVGTGLTGSVLAGVVNSALVQGTLALPDTLLNAVTTGLTNTLNLQGTNATTRQTRPSPVNNYPACNQAGWSSPGNCFNVIPTTATPTLPVGSLLALSLGTVQGYATGDSQGYLAASGSTHPIIALPGLAIDLGVASSNVQCSTALICTPTHTFTGASITTSAGTSALTLATGSTLASIGSTVIPNLTSIPIVGTAANPLISATANGNFLSLNVTLSLDQYLQALGTSLTAIGSVLGDALTATGVSITLSVTIGPGSLNGTNASSASAWGLEVGVNLVADIKLNLNLLGTGGLLGGLLGALLGSVELTTGGASYPGTPGSTPNLLDLKLAYSEGTAGALPPDFVPPGLI